LDKLRTAVIGVGGAGGNIVSSIYDDFGTRSGDATFSILNTDVQALESLVEKKRFNSEFNHQIGQRTTNGLGAGSVPEMGEAAAKEDIALVRSIVQDKDLIMVVAGLGGGTGSGAIPILLYEAKKAGALTICWSVIPFEYEGPKRNKIAKQALKQVDEMADSYIVISNDVVDDVVFKDAMDHINITISNGIETMLQVLLEPSLINLDFADFTTVLKGGGRCVFSYASFDGQDRPKRVSDELLKFSLQPSLSTRKIRQSVIFVRGGTDMRKDEIQIVSSSIQKKLNEDALMLLGVSVTEEKQSLDAVFFGTVEEK